MDFVGTVATTDFEASTIHATGVAVAVVAGS